MHEQHGVLAEHDRARGLDVGRHSGTSPVGRAVGGMVVSLTSPGAALEGVCGLRSSGRSSWSSPARWCWPSQGSATTRGVGRTRASFSRAVASTPAGSERLSWTDWAGVRRELGSDVDARSTADELRTFLDDAYDADLSSRSALLQSAPALQTTFGFSPASAEWELFSQSTDGAVITLRMPDDTDFGDLADRLTELGYPPPENEDGVWAGGPDLLSALSANLTPELAYVVLDPDEHLVMASDQQPYLEAAASAATGDGDGVDGLDEVTEALGEPLSAAVYAGEYACGALAMGQADSDDQAEAAELVAAAGTVDPYLAFAMGVRPAATYESRSSSPTTTRRVSTPTAAPRSRPARPSARAATSPTASRSRSARADGSLVLLDLDPVDGEYVLSDLTSGPVLFATC